MITNTFALSQNVPNALLYLDDCLKVALGFVKLVETFVIF